MKISAKVLAMVLGLSLGLAACGKKKEDDQAGVRAARDAGAANGISGMPSGAPYAPGPGAQVINSDVAALNRNVKALVSTTMDPTKVGSVERITLQGQVALNNGRMVTSNAKIGLEIQDDARDSDGNKYQPITITVLGTSGQLSNGNMNLVFSDAYGTITISGTYNTTTINGTVSFQNAQSYNGASGILGTFSMPACNFFECQ